MKVVLPTICALMCTVSFSYANNLGEGVKIPMVDKGIVWDSNIELEATIYKPVGEGPFPTVVFSHGSTGPGVIPEDQTINPWGFGRYLVDKNIALVVPMRRGRGQSEGSYKELYSCEPKEIAEGMEYAEQSLEAAMSFLMQQDWVDREKMILAGNSRGGILSLAYASHNPGKVAGVINFAGGWVGDVCNRDDKSQNIPLFEQAGKQFNKPTLFIYGSNDSYYSDATIKCQAEAYKEAGGDVNFQFYQFRNGAAGHHVFYEYGYLWSGVVDSYLAKINAK